MSPPPDADDDLTLAQNLEDFADAIATYKNTPGLDGSSWTTLDNIETDLRAKAALLTVEAVTASLAAAGQSLAAVQASVKDAQAAVQKIAAAASALQKIAAVITLAGTLVGIAGAISAGNAGGVIAGLKALPAQITALKGAA